MKLPKPEQLAIAQIVGPWACERSYLASYVDLVRNVDLVALEGQTRAVADPENPWDAPLYELTDSGVALISMSGPMTKRPNWLQRYYGGTATMKVRKSIDAALADPQVQAWGVIADSPGGMHAGTSELACTIRAASQVKPGFTFAEDMACSAALWAIAGGARVYANRAAIIGSIGTYLVVWDQSAMYAAAGVKVHVISSAPPIKGAGVPGSEVLPEQLTAWKKNVMDMSELFVGSLAELRGLGIEDVRALATGDIWGAEEAKSHGLIDDVLSLSEAIDLVRKEKPMSKSTAVSTSPAAAAPALAESSAAPAAAPAATPAAAAEPPTTPATPAPATQAASPEAAAAVTVTAEELAALRTRAERAEADAVAARASAATLEQAERTRRFTGIASRLGLPTAMVGVLDRIEATMGSEVFSALETAFSAKKFQAANPTQFNEHGTSEAPPANGEGSAFAQLQAIANQMVADKKAPTYSAALALAAQQNPGLAAQTRPSGA